MKILTIIAILFLTGCATDGYVLQKKNIENAYSEGKITKIEELKLLNDLYKSSQNETDVLLVH